MAPTITDNNLVSIWLHSGEIQALGSCVLYQPPLGLFILQSPSEQGSGLSHRELPFQDVSPAFPFCPHALPQDSTSTLSCHPGAIKLLVEGTCK